MTRISVLINNHDYGRYLPAALDSVLAQDMPLDDVEIIAVDDGSTDDSREVLARYAPRVRSILLPQNKGQAAAFNAGFEAASGEILCLLDSDDWWGPDKLRRVLARFEEEKDLGIVQHWCQEIGPGGKPLPGHYPPLPPRYEAADFLNGSCVFTGTTGLSFRAAVLRRILPVPEELAICADTYLYNSLLDAPLGNIGEVLAYRRVHDGNRYAGRWRDPIRLRAHRRALAVHDRELARLLAPGGRSLSERAKHDRRTEELLEELFLARYAGDWKTARQRWTQCVLQHRGAQRLGKAISLAVALISPELYLDLQGVYAHLRAG